MCLLPLCTCTRHHWGLKLCTDIMCQPDTPIREDILHWGHTACRVWSALWHVRFHPCALSSSCGSQLAALRAAQSIVQDRHAAPGLGQYGQRSLLLPVVTWQTCRCESGSGDTCGSWCITLASTLRHIFKGACTAPCCLVRQTATA